MTEEENLFIKTLADIQKRLGEVDPYEILMISGLIRKLFLDDFPLVDQVNRKHQKKIVFEVAVPLNRPKDEPMPIFWTIQDGLDPDTALPFKHRQQLKRDQFFQTTVAIINARPYSVRDVVLFQANVMGGIHVGSPKADKEHVLKQIDQTISVGGYASSLRQLKAIGRVVLKALAPLRQAVSP